MMTVLLSFVDRQKHKKTKKPVGTEMLNNFLKITDLASGVPGIQTWLL